MADASVPQAVNEDGIPISQPSPELMQELGIGAQQASAKPDVSANPNLAGDIANYVVQGPDKALAIARQRGEFVGPPAPASPAVDMVPPGAALPAPQQGAPGAAQQQPGIKDLGDGSALVPTPDGRSIRVAISALSPDARSRLMPVPVGTGMGEINRLQRAADAGNKEVLDAQNAVARDQKQAINQQYDVQRQQSEDTYKLQVQQQQNENRLIQDGQQHQQDLQQVVQQRASDLRSIQSRMGQMTFDPDRYMKNRSVGESMLSAIGIALGGLGQAFIPGAQNTGIEALKRHIEGDVQAQREAYNRLGDQANFANSAYAQARQAKMDDYQATIAARQVSMDQLKTGLAVVGAKYASPGAEANRKAAIATVDDMSTKNLAEYHKVSAVHGLQYANARQQQRQFAWQQRTDMAQFGLQSERISLSAAEAAAKQKQALTIPGFEGVVATPDEHKEAIKIAANERTLMPRLDKLINYRTREGNEFINQTDKAMAKSTAAQLKVMFKDKFGLGVMSESDSKLLDSIISDPTAVAWTPAVVGTLKQLRNQVVEDTTNTMDAYGLKRSRVPAPYIDQQPIEGGK